MGCLSDSIILPVTIQEKLEPVLPMGLDTVCWNNAQGQVYATNFTNGSVYDWHTRGILTGGHKSNEVTLNWPSTGLYDIYVTEHSVTLSAVCDGSSPKFNILVYQDSADLVFDYVSVKIRVHNWVPENNI